MDRFWRSARWRGGESKPGKTLPYLDISQSIRVSVSTNRVKGLKLGANCLPNGARYLCITEDLQIAFWFSSISVASRDGRGGGGRWYTPLSLKG